MSALRFEGENFPVIEVDHQTSITFGDYKRFVLVFPDLGEKIGERIEVLRRELNANPTTVVDTVFELNRELRNKWQSLLKKAATGCRGCIFASGREPVGIHDHVIFIGLCTAFHDRPISILSPDEAVQARFDITKTEASSLVPDSDPITPCGIHPIDLFLRTS